VTSRCPDPKLIGEKDSDENHLDHANDVSRTSVCNYPCRPEFVRSFLYFFKPPRRRSAAAPPPLQAVGPAARCSTSPDRPAWPLLHTGTCLLIRLGSESDFRFDQRTWL
jgi:hypothetical protein